MAEIRKIASLALEARAAAGIKVRQPLQKLKIKNLKFKINENLLNILRDEINVKEIIFDPKIKNEVELDTKITPELKAEGQLRELVRLIQDLRKKAGLIPQNKINLAIETDEAGEKFIKDFENEIKKGTNSIEIELAKIGGEETKPRTEFNSNAWVKIDELKFKIEIKK